jgi:septum formation protein
MSRSSPSPLVNLVLASASPRRRDLLEGLQLSFEVRSTEIDESLLADETPEDHVLRLARSKAQATAFPGELVLAADTVVVLGDRILGKPAGPADAQQMLSGLAGKQHTVYTGVALYVPGRDALALAMDRSEVRIAALSDEEVAWYVSTGEPLDKAGSYAIQGLGALFVEAIEGNYTNVVGLPLPTTRALFRQLGHNILDFRTD